ncbi:hypothetical protein D3C76_1789990 [compost metagenome]
MFVTVMIAVLVGSILVSRKMKSRGIVYGAVFGILFCLLIYLFTVLTYRGFFVSDTLLIYFGTSLLSGIVGGVIGVNIQ